MLSNDLTLTFLIICLVFLFSYYLMWPVMFRHLLSQFIRTTCVFDITLKTEFLSEQCCARCSLVVQTFIIEKAGNLIKPNGGIKPYAIILTENSFFPRSFFLLVVGGGN